ncbi:MarR family winged helix-turn-helix transcriptional regulator [Acidocella sp.]|uniref:MarR family winged helix-turn-helix transcriptional regulator n=1 Tax=Acidocella sp. TaxID=50710 RepID=UPI00261E25D6|nr:MarR family winged helix-turn-helix transcriptional regulator [Acidocella sp.]
MDTESGIGQVSRDAERQPGFLIRRLHQIHTALFAEEAAGLEVTPPQYGVLSVIAAQPGLDQSAIAEEIGVDRATLASVVARLEAAGFVRRTISKADRRQKLLSLTPRGKAILTRMQDPVQRAQERILEPLPPKDREQFLKLLNRLVDGGNDHGRAKLRLR